MDVLIVDVKKCASDILVQCMVSAENRIQHRFG